MQAFFQKLFLFALPFLLGIAGIVWLDPYGFIGADSPEEMESRKHIAFPLNYTFWKYNQYRQQPKPNILLGDSRMEALTEEQVREVSGKDYFNFAYGGGTVPEMIQTFWFASQQTQLKKVVMGLNFGRYNAFVKENRCQEAQNLLDYPYMYLFNQSVLKSSFYLMKEKLGGTKTQIGKPLMDREAFWEHQLDFLARRFYQEYAYPESFFHQLKEIADYCATHEIALSFVILPTHAELQDQIIRYGRQQELTKYKADLHLLGRVYDFHQKNELTLDKERYKDPFHFKPEVGEVVIKEVIGTCGMAQVVD
ncbi:MAG: hypothetical protein AAFR61_14985 [Bacteroidota bacterium]